MADSWRNYNKNKWFYSQSSPTSSSWNQSWRHYPKTNERDESLDDTKMTKSESPHGTGDSTWKSEKGQKRDRSEDLGEVEHQPSWKVFSRSTGDEPLDIDGNRMKREDMTIIQQPPDFISTTNQAMWLIVEEPIPESYNTPWLRPAARLSQELESQYQSRQGLRRCELEHNNTRGQTSTTFYEHDLRNHPWVQRKFRDKERHEPISVKEIHRIALS